MLISLLKFFDPLVVFCFEAHDFVSNGVAKNFLLIKRSLLVIAYLSLFFLFFPEMRKDFGNLAESMLLGILFLSPLSKIFRMKLLVLLMGIRREFGILMGCFALVHGVGYLMEPELLSFGILPYIFFGILSLILTLLLFLTANNFSVRLLGGKKWKMLHRLAYVILLTVLLHVFFVRNTGENYDVVELLQPASIILGYILLKILAWKNSLPFLRDTTLYVSGRYEAYTLAKKTDARPQVM